MQQTLAGACEDSIVCAVTLFGMVQGRILCNQRGEWPSAFVRQELNMGPNRIREKAKARLVSERPFF